MNVTFLIGNGFDISLGMKTKFTDMYDAYTDSPSSSAVIDEFKKFLKSNAGDNYRTWSDFEIAMGRHAKNYSNEDDFIECIRDFRDYMAEYLQFEEESFLKELEKVHGSRASIELRRSFNEFYKNVSPNVTNKIEIIKDDKLTGYSFIVFNYTEVFDKILASYNANRIYPEPIHIHGRLSGDVVLGVDNSEQLENITFPVTKRLSRAFIKPAFNEYYDYVRAQNAEVAIYHSDVICVYGMSFGLSDYTWTSKIYEWLIESPDHHLFYYGSCKNKFSNLWRSDEIADIEDNQKELLLSRICKEPEEVELLFDRVHVPLRNDIFKFKELIDAQLLREEEIINQNNVNTARTTGSRK